MVLFALFPGKLGGEIHGKGIVKIWTWLYVEFYTPCVLWQKKKKKRRKKKKVEDCGSNMEQRRPEVIPAVHRRTGEKLVSSRIKS